MWYFLHYALLPVSLLLDRVGDFGHMRITMLSVSQHVWVEVTQDLLPSRSGIMTEKVVEKLSQNPFTYLLSTRIEISASSGSR